MVDRKRAGKVGEEEDARLQRRDQQRLPLVVVGDDLARELGYALTKLRTREVDLADRGVYVYDASSSRYRCASRSTSRL
jgi:hypothetical protein